MMAKSRKTADSITAAAERAPKSGRTRRPSPTATLPVAPTICTLHVAVNTDTTWTTGYRRNANCERVLPPLRKPSLDCGAPDGLARKMGQAARQEVRGHELDVASRVSSFAKVLTLPPRGHAATAPVKTVAGVCGR